MSNSYFSLYASKKITPIANNTKRKVMPTTKRLQSSPKKVNRMATVMIMARTTAIHDFEFRSLILYKRNLAIHIAPLPKNMTFS